MSPHPPDVTSSFIATDAALAAACGRWAAAGVIGVDTEFVRERTYYPIPALLQVNDGHAVALVDVLAISEFTPFAAVLADRAVVKVMHSCSEDIEVLELLTGATPRRLFDTQLAGAFAGHGYSLGYRGLVKELMAVELDKGETRSNWLGRPLSPAQLRYAALDVVYLTPLYEQLSSDLATLGRADWLDEEFEYQCRARAADKQPGAAYLKVRRRGALSAANHAVLRGLTEWRETEAMVRDIPRRHLLSDEVLLALAKAPRRDDGALPDIRGLSDRTTARYGPPIVVCLETARRQGPAEVDTLVNLRPYAGILERLKKIVRRRAESLDLPPELLANRRGLEALLISMVRGNGDTPEAFRGWRSAAVTQPLLDCIHERRP